MSDKNKESGVIEMSGELKKELALNEKVREYVERLNDENEDLKLKLAIQEQPKEEKKAVPLITFDGVICGQRFAYKLIAVLRFSPDTVPDDNFKEVLKRFEEHILSFSFSRGDTRITIAEFEKFEEAQKEDNEEIAAKKAREEEIFAEEKEAIEKYKKEHPDEEEEEEEAGGYSGDETERKA